MVGGVGGMKQRPLQLFDEDEPEPSSRHCQCLQYYLHNKNLKLEKNKEILPSRSVGCNISD